MIGRTSSMSSVKMILTPYAYWRLQWLCHRTPCEVSTMGLISPAREGFLIEDFILVKQTVSAATVDLDMAWWAEKQIELFEKNGIEPWRTSCWCHTHPQGVDEPSQTDEETMIQSFGEWDFVLMLILTKAGVFYARMDFEHEFGNGEVSRKSRFSAQCAVKVQWSAAGKIPVLEDTIQGWEKEFQELVHEQPNGWLADWPIGTKDRPKLAIPNQSKTTEVQDYAQYCESLGFDPNDPTAIEQYFGCVPEPFL